MTEKVKIGIDREEVDARLLAIGRVQLRLADVNNRMNRRLDNIKAEYAKELGDLADEELRLATSLTLSCAQSRDQLLPGKGKTVKGLFGFVQFRQQPVSIMLQENVEMSDAVDLVESSSAMMQYVRLVCALDKAALGQALRDGKVTAEDVEACGLLVSGGGEDVIYEVDRAKVAEQLQKKAGV